MNKAKGKKCACACYAEKVKEAIIALKERAGSSIPAIIKAIKEKCKDADEKAIKLTIKRMAKSHMLVKVKNSYKLSLKKATPVKVSKKKTHKKKKVVKKKKVSKKPKKTVKKKKVHKKKVVPEKKAEEPKVEKKSAKKPSPKKESPKKESPKKVAPKKKAVEGC